MKQKITNSLLAVLFFPLSAVNTLEAQDTVRVNKVTVVHDTVVSVKERDDDENKLYRGEFGLRYLPTFTSLSLRNDEGDAVQGKATMSNGFGIMLGFNFSSYVGMQAEINYDQISQKYKDQGLDKQVDINYINIPLLLTINTDKTFPVFFGVSVGPQFGINIGSSFNGESNNSTAKDTLKAELAVKQGDVGVAYGAGFGISLNKERSIRLDFGFRGMYGLVDMSGTPTSDNSYNILMTGSRKAYGGYGGITFLF